MVKREIVGAHYGLRDWLAQRITAVVMGVYTLMILAVLANMPRLDYSHWKALWDLPVMRYATLLFLLSLYFHAWIGMRNIFMDYIKNPGGRLLLHVITIAALVWYALWSIQIVWRLHGVAG
jgi:succinate dehydrogenase / fumarate reductase membrane anchor subunit